jgi:hypothetical protein
MAVTLQSAADGDTKTVHETLALCGESICEVAAETNNETVDERVNPEGPAELVLDNPPPIRINSRLLFSFAFPVPASPLRLRTVSPNAAPFDTHHRVVAVITLGPFAPVNSVAL